MCVKVAFRRSHSEPPNYEYKPWVLLALVALALAWRNMLKRWDVESLPTRAILRQNAWPDWRLRLWIWTHYSRKAT